MDVSMITTYLTLIIAIISIVGTLVSVGTVFGLLRGKVTSLKESQDSDKVFLTSQIENLQNNYDHKISELDKKVEDRYQTIKESLDDKYTSFIGKLDNCYSKIELIDDKFNGLRNHFNIEIKDVNQSVKKIADNCLLKKHSIDSIPDLSDRVKKLEIDIGVLPSKLSEELSRAFSDEYKKLVTSLSKNKNNNT